MGGSLSVAHVDRTRESILLTLHTQLKYADEPLSSLALAAFRRVDWTQRGWIASSNLDTVLRDLGLTDRWNRLHIDAFMQCFMVVEEDESEGPRTSSRLDYVVLLDVLFFPIQVSRECAQLKITQQAVVSAGGWLVHDGEYAGRTVAIKEVGVRDSQNGNQNESIVLQLRNRVNALRLVSHPNLLRYITTVQSIQSIYVVHHAHSSCTLRTILHSFGPMKEATIRRYIVQILDALSFLHTHDIVHGNLHLESIHIDSSGLLKLSDYGASTEYHKLLSLSTETNDWIHRFSPPEHAKSPTARATKATDVWTVGVLILQMAYGVGNEAELALQEPVARTTTARALLSGVTPSRGHPPLPTSMSTDLREVVQACLQSRARARSTIEQVSYQPFFQVDPEQAKREILQNVCSDLDESMDRLRSSQEARPGARTGSARLSAPQLRFVRPSSAKGQRS